MSDTLHLIDTHCHLPSLTHDSLENILRRAEDASVRSMICIGAGEGIKAAGAAVSLAEAHENIWASVGIHPHDANQIEGFPEIEQLARHSRVVAIGETGLDFFKDWAPRDLQQECFERSIALARRVSKPLIIHCRDAVRETLDMLRRANANEVGGVFHCYAGDASLARELAELNFRVSLTGILTFKSAHALRETAREIPLSQLMLETDAPYMAPEPYRGKPSEPAHVRLIAERLATIKGSSLREIADVTTRTAQTLFRLPVPREC